MANWRATVALTDEQGTMHMPETERNAGLWEIADVAEYLRVSERTVRRRIKEDGLPHRVIGGKLRFIPDEVGEWVDQLPGMAA